MYRASNGINRKSKENISQVHRFQLKNNAAVGTIISCCLGERFWSLATPAPHPPKLCRPLITNPIFPSRRAATASQKSPRTHLWSWVPLPCVPHSPQGAPRPVPLHPTASWCFSSEGGLPWRGVLIREMELGAGAHTASPSSPRRERDLYPWR